MIPTQANGHGVAAALMELSALLEKIVQLYNIAIPNGGAYQDHKDIKNYYNGRFRAILQTAKAAEAKRQ